MNKMFCQACGKATEFTFSKPSSCVWCKTPFCAFVPERSNKSKDGFFTPPSLSSSSPPINKSNPNLGFDIDDKDDNGDDDDNKSDGLLEINIKTPVRAQSKTTIGQIVSSAGPNPLPPTPIVGKQARARRTSSKKILQEFQKEAGAIKPQSHLRGKKLLKK